MEYRRLGRTELNVSLLGIGCGYLGMLDRPAGRRLLAQAHDLGVNYFDGRYGDSNAFLRPLLADHRDRCIVSTKTNDTTAEGAQKRIDEDRRELGTDYLDVFMLRVYDHEMLDAHLAPGGSMDQLQRAKQAGDIRFVGISGHGDMTALARGIETGLVDVVLFPLNIVRRESLDTVVPAAQAHDVGMAIMKPVSVGMLPGDVALRWLADHPVHTAVPGITTLEELQEDVAALEQPFDVVDLADVGRLFGIVAATACRQCMQCEPCPEGLTPIFRMIYSDVWYNHYRNLGLPVFLAQPWAPWAKAAMVPHFRRRLELLNRCTRCGLCEERCPHGVHILDQFDEMLSDHPILIHYLERLGWEELYRDAPSPYG